MHRSTRGWHRCRSACVSTLFADTCPETHQPPYRTSLMVADDSEMLACEWPHAHSRAFPCEPGHHASSSLSHPRTDASIDSPSDSAALQLSTPPHTDSSELTTASKTLSRELNGRSRRRHGASSSHSPCQGRNHDVSAAECDYNAGCLEGPSSLPEITHARTRHCPRRVRAASVRRFRTLGRGAWLVLISGRVDATPCYCTTTREGLGAQPRKVRLATHS